jgi:hypothetical protein|nr:hypothetical protein [uncultured Acetatifactor sp.]
MEMQEMIGKAEQDIRQALKDYGAHTSQTGVLDDVSERFIRRLARDSSHAKQGLRGLFSRSPVWDERIDALVINGTRTHDPDYDRILELGLEILQDALDRDDDRHYNILQALNLFCCAHQSETDRDLSIAAINALAPKAYTPTKKPGRVFKALCDALGIADEVAGSRFQRLFAQFADELAAKKIGFKLYVSLNPAHFLTMSNPKGDDRGATLTSCHSFNSTEYKFNNGCSGYARDVASFIAFTVADDGNPEAFNNRKTTRQVFAYRPGSGLLLQSRMYNTSGGTRGAQADSRLYRDLIQREISMLEDVPNLWRTVPSTGEKSGWVDAGYGFGGYADWTYADFDGHISFRSDFDEKRCGILEVGTYGLCIRCGDEISEGLYCYGCREDKPICNDCGEHCDGLDTAYDIRGNEVHVCGDCLDSNYQYCEICHRYHDNGDMRHVGGRDICSSCLSEHYEQCKGCGEWFKKGDTYGVYGRNGYSIQVCGSCRGGYVRCSDCDGYYHPDNTRLLIRVGGRRGHVCNDCAHNYMTCPYCSGLIEACGDGTCPSCREAIEERKGETA